MTNTVARTNKIAVVTGASGGVGRATAVAFAERGFDVALLARGEAGLAAAAHDVKHADGRALCCAVDVAEFDEVDAAATRIEQELGPIDVWVNDAMTTVFSPFAELAPADFKRAVEVTFLGQVWGTKAALDRMRPRNRGSIVNVGSALAFIGIPLQTPYCASKFACRGFFESVRAELIHDHSNVRMSMVHLPAVNTPQFDWCKSNTQRRAMPVPPIYQPELPARVIVDVALDGRRAKVLGSWNKLLGVRRPTLSGTRESVRRHRCVGCTADRRADEGLRPGQPARAVRRRRRLRCARAIRRPGRRIPRSGVPEDPPGHRPQVRRRAPRDRRGEAAPILRPPGRVSENRGGRIVNAIERSARALDRFQQDARSRRLSVRRVQEVR